MLMLIELDIDILCRDLYSIEKEEEKILKVERDEGGWS
jgi:hypothetical protein